MIEGIDAEDQTFAPVKGCVQTVRESNSNQILRSNCLRSFNKCPNGMCFCVDWATWLTHRTGYCNDVMSSSVVVLCVMSDHCDHTDSGTSFDPHTLKSQWGSSSVQTLLVSTGSVSAITLQLRTHNNVPCSGTLVTSWAVKTHWCVWSCTHRVASVHNMLKRSADGS